MASCYQHCRGGWYVREKTASGSLAQIYLGQVPKKFAVEFAKRLTDLAIANRLNLDDSAAIACAMGLAKQYQTLLRKHGFLRIVERAEYTTETWFQICIDKSTGKGSTKKGLTTAKNTWARLLGNVAISTVTTGQARDGMEDLVSTCSPSHAGRLCERGRMFFQRALEHGHITTNPFAGLKIPNKSIDKTRQFYVGPKLFEDVVSKARHSEASLLFLMARYAGLRVPSEPLALTWDCIDWEKGRISIPNDTKTGWRVLPIFQEFYKELSIRNSNAPDGATFVFTTARKSAGTTWREWLEEAIEKAKVPQWSKLWVNLRASCRTDLAERHPAQVCDAWLGHSTQVAKDHYLLVTPQHWEAAHSTPSQRTAQVTANNPG
jgi:integrase